MQTYTYVYKPVRLFCEKNCLIFQRVNCKCFYCHCMYNCVKNRSIVLIYYVEFAKNITLFSVVTLRFFIRKFINVTERFFRRGGGGGGGRGGGCVEFVNQNRNILSEVARTASIFQIVVADVQKIGDMLLTTSHFSHSIIMNFLLDAVVFSFKQITLQAYNRIHPPNQSQKIISSTSFHNQNIYNFLRYINMKFSVQQGSDRFANLVIENQQTTRQKLRPVQVKF